MESDGVFFVDPWHPYVSSTPSMPRRVVLMAFDVIAGSGKSTLLYVVPR